MKRFRIGDLPLTSGGVLPDVVLACETFGELNQDCSNAILVTHGLTSGTDMLAPSTTTGEGSWADLLGQGRALDERRYFVVCSNVVGSSLGSTSPTSQRPGTNHHWGPDFPALTIGDMVRAQRMLLDALGVRRLRCVLGPSFGGLQAMQWALDYPEMVEAIGVVVSGLCWPSSHTVAPLRHRLAADPAWAQGWYRPGRDLLQTMAALRRETLLSYGMQAVLRRRWPGDARRADLAIHEAAQGWAQRFDANALLVLQAAAEQFDVRHRLAQISCPMLFVPSRSDVIFPPTVEQRCLLNHVQLPLIYRELDTDLGHSASGVELSQWEGDLELLLGQAARTYPLCKEFT